MTRSISEKIDCPGLSMYWLTVSIYGFLDFWKKSLLSNQYYLSFKSGLIIEIIKYACISLLFLLTGILICDWSTKKRKTMKISCQIAHYSFILSFTVAGCNEGGGKQRWMLLQLTFKSPKFLFVRSWVSMTNPERDKEKKKEGVCCNWWPDVAPIPTTPHCGHFYLKLSKK